ncbi:MAG: PAS domain S-box protein, partial [Caldilineaceae bacterium]|nr:PAS domain S-box protein [Caldilineaceae bacterium]
RTALDEAQWDIVISDYVLPTFSGLEALAELKRRALDIPFILVSGKVGEDVAVEAMRAGAHDYILKHNLTRLVPAVERELREAALRRDRIRARSALVEQDARFRALVQYSSDIIFILSADGVIRYESASVNRVLGHRDVGLLGGSIFDLVHPDDKVAVFTAFQRALENDDRVTPFPEYRFQRADGAWIHLETLANNLLGHEHVMGVVLYSRDVSERKEAQAISHRLERLQVELDKERELRELKSRFVSMVSHQFRTPLTVVQTTAALLQEHWDAFDVDQRDARFARIQSQLAQMTSLMDEILTIGEVEAGRTVFQTDPVDLARLCEDIVEEQSVGHAADRRFIIYRTEDPILVTGDERLLRKAVGNLVSNAVKYSAAGSTVELILRTAGEQVSLSIKDEGIGIPASDLQRLFDAFHRAGNVGDTPGTGL